MFTSAPRITGWLVGLSLFGSPFGSAPATAQDGVRLAGVVVDEAAWTPVSAAKITILGTDLETASAQNGTFEFSEQPLGPASVRVEAPGFLTMVEEVDLRPGAVVFVQFILPSVDAFLDEILVVGRRSEPGASLVESRTAADLLAGQVVGMGSNSGMVGLSLAQIQLRGVSSITVRREPDIFLNGARLAGTTGDALKLLGMIPASDVKDIQILRGPVAAFLQGSPDGAIFVRTKSGRPDR